MSGTAASSSRAGTRRLRRLRTTTDSTLFIALLAAASACHDRAPTIGALTRYAAPEAFVSGQLCSDMGTTRVCWRGTTVAIVPRVVPGGPAPPQGWRCGGDGRGRVCEDRGRNASAFDCGTQRCLEERPRMPDDGEWECVEMSGVVLCHSRGEGAGMAAGPMDLGWLCGPRRSGASGERICVDFDADRPDGAPAASAQRCRFEPRFGATRRSCTPEPTPRIGGRCSASSKCPDGSRCSAGVCLPERPQPGCFIDRDCGDDSHCVYGSCRGA